MWINSNKASCDKPRSQRASIRSIFFGTIEIPLTGAMDLLNSCVSLDNPPCPPLLKGGEGGLLSLSFVSLRNIFVFIVFDCWGSLLTLAYDIMLYMSRFFPLIV